MKKVITFLSIMMLAFGLTVTFVHAGDNTDKPYTYEFTSSAYHSYQRTEGRRKYDDSSLYMHYQSGNIAYTAYAIGGYSSNTAYNSCHKDPSTGKTYAYIFYPGYKRYMYNYVQENGYTYAAIQAYTTRAGGTAKGVWSPDSVYEDGVATPDDYLRD